MRVPSAVTVQVVSAFLCAEDLETFLGPTLWQHTDCTEAVTALKSDFYDRERPINLAPHSTRFACYVVVEVEPRVGNTCNNNTYFMKVSNA
jgi:hypothetical protein